MQSGRFLERKSLKPKGEKRGGKMYDLLFGKLLGEMPGIVVAIFFISLVIPVTFFLTKNQYTTDKILLCVCIAITVLMLASSLVLFNHQPLLTFDIVGGIFAGVIMSLMIISSFVITRRLRKMKRGV